MQVVEQTPREQVAHGIRELRRKAGDLRATLNQIATITDRDRRPYLLTRGWEKSQIMAIAETLESVQRELWTIGATHERRMAEELLPLDAQLDLVEEDE